MNEVFIIKCLLSGFWGFFCGYTLKPLPLALLMAVAGGFLISFAIDLI